MGDEHLLEDRDGVRTPMQWEDAPTAGFSTADPGDLYLPIVSSAEYSPTAVNVADQRDDPDSLLHWTRRMLSIRADLPVMGEGGFRIVPAQDPAVLYFERTGTDIDVLVVANFSDVPVRCELDIDDPPTMALAATPGVSIDGPVITLGPYGWAWFAASHP